MDSMNSTDSPDTTAARLTRVLFGAEFARVHAPWRRLVAAEPFRRPVDATAAERVALAYARLRTVNHSLDSPLALAADPRRLVALYEWLGPVDSCLTTVAGIHYNLFLGSLLDHGFAGGAFAGGAFTGGTEGQPGPAGQAGQADEPARDPRELADFLGLRRVGTFLCTEVAHGNDAAALETTATYDRARDGFVLHTPHAGAQKFMPNTSPVGGPKSGVVAARLLVDGADHGVFLFLTPLTDGERALPGVRVRRLPAVFGSPVDHSLTSFDRVFVARNALLGGAQGRLGADGAFSSEQSNRRRRFLTSIGRVTTGKLSMSAGALGGARVALALAVRYGGHRLISGARAVDRVPVLAHRTHHGPLVGALATVFAMSLLHRAALDAWLTHTEETKGEAERTVAVAKGWITWQARGVILEARERCGAQGLLESNGLAELMAGAEGAITAEGDNLAIYAKAAAEMLFSAGAPARESFRREDCDDGRSRGGRGQGGSGQGGSGHGGSGHGGSGQGGSGPGGCGGCDDDGGTGGSARDGAVRAGSVSGPGQEGSAWADSGPGSGVRAGSSSNDGGAGDESAAARGDESLAVRELSDTRFLGSLLADVEDLWLARARRRMSRAAPHADSLARWNAASGAALRAVEAHAYRRAAEAFTAAVDGLESGTEAHELLRSLHRLFALRWIDRNSGDLLAAGRLAPRHTEGLVEAVERLVAELAGHAPTLVDAFALPEEMLADWPISGAGYVDAYDDAKAAWHSVPA
ncbi:acyl-CoA dehydrogenase [Streptomyces odonnellii]|uniref:acyl-CoA dehydrogenase n=1 Tax=Streptomyces odonnellii TaxID=1417980 RepID=UPI0038CDBEF0